VKNIDSHKYYIYGATIALPIICSNLVQGFKVMKGMEITIYVFSLFLFNMVCHGELYKSRPESENLTKFYLMISFGGAIGTFFVAFISPLIFIDFYELHISILIFALILLSLYMKGFNQFIRKRSMGRTLLFFFIPFFIVVIPGFYFLSTFDTHKLIYSSRNFYGIQKVYKQKKTEKSSEKKIFFSGNTIHGFQYNDERSNIPNAYYGKKSGLGMVIESMKKEKNSLNIADIGLGIGTISGYGRERDKITFFELNPQVEVIAKKYFTFLESASSEIKIIIGDGRLKLEENKEKFDLIILDAFSGDGVPIHLLTKEAFTIYKNHLKSDGVIVANISNLYIDLKPVFNSIVDYFSFKHIFIIKESDHK
jgi:hypothetical protein